MRPPVQKTDYMALIAKGHAFFRMINQGLDYAVVRQSMAAVYDETQWFPIWTKVAGLYRTLGQQKSAEGFGASAGQFLAKAALAYHFAQYLHFSDLGEKAQASRLKAACYDQALGLHSVPGRRLMIPFESVELPAVLRCPRRARGLPLALLVCGSDSTKEEHWAIEGQFHARGFATLSFDGPGQGELDGIMPMRPDYHRAVSAVIDALSEQPEIDIKKIGLVGFGFGGMLAASSACFDERIAACVAVSGYFDMSVMDWRDTIRAWRFAHLVGVDGIEHAMKAAEQFSLKGCIDRVQCPLLVMHGLADAGIPASAARRIAEEAGRFGELVEVEGAVHCMHNMSWQANPIMVDWLQTRLGLPRV